MKKLLTQPTNNAILRFEENNLYKEPHEAQLQHVTNLSSRSVIIELEANVK